MERSRKVVVFLLVLGLAGFGYSQYASASQIGVEITRSELVGEDGAQSDYNIQLQLENPSLLYLSAGQTEFAITADGENIGHGRLVPFTLPPLSSSHAEGTFETFRQLEDSADTPTVKISGVTQYDLAVTTVDVPFVFYPSEEQAREFIHRD